MRKIYPAIFFFVLSLLIVLSWFKNGLYYGGAEVGVSPYYNPARYLNIQQFIWWGDVAPGSLVPQFVSAVPFYFILSFLQNLLSPLMLQVFLFFCLLFLMGYGMYLFALSYVGKDKTPYVVIAGLFYMINSYTLVEVWHRFLYTGFFLVAFLPILALFWKYWIKKGVFIYLIIVLLINLISSYMFGNLTSFLVIWLLFFLLTVADIFFPWQGKKNFIKLSCRFILGLILFILTNLWWLIPVVKVSTAILPEQHNLEDNISTLVNISKQTILPFTLQYANPFYLFYSQELGVIYKSLIFLILPWLPAIVIFVGLISSLRTRKFASLGLFYLVAVWIAKGAALPFGYPYIWGFMNIFRIGVIRNPFEKLGILLPFFGSILFVIGLETLFLICTKKFGIFFSKSIVLTILISILIYSFPMFTGKVFNKPDYPLTVKVPQTYEQANDWLKMQKNEQGNILHLPFPSRDVVTYNWEHGYHGVEINETLFTALPSITRNVGIKRVDETLKSLSFIFNKPFLNVEQILNLLQSFNVSYIILHKDVRWDDVPTYGKDIGLNNPLEIENTLNNLVFLEKSTTFGDLVVYKLKDNFYQPKIVFSNYGNDLVYPGESDILQILALSQKNNQITPVGKEPDKEILSNLSQALIFPEKVLYNWEPSSEKLENLVNQILLNLQDQSSPFVQIVQMKQVFFSQTGELLSETLINRMIMASNKLIDLTKTRINGNTDSIREILETYDNLIDNIFTKGFNGSSVQHVIKPLITKIFTLHLYILERFSEGAQTSKKLQAMKIHNKLNDYLIKNDVLPAFRLDRKTIVGESQRRIHRFSVPIKEKYELLMTTPGALVLYPDVLARLNVQLDGKSVAIKIYKEGDYLNLGEIELNKGIHEISYEVAPSANLVSDLDKFIFIGNSEKVGSSIRLGATQQSGGAVKTALPTVKGGDSYEVTFEASSENAREFYIQISEDTQDQNNPYDCSKVSCYAVKPNPQITGWQNFTLVVDPTNLASRNVNFQILLPAITTGSPNPSIMQIRNLRLNRIMGNNLILRNKLQIGITEATTSAKLIKMKKINAVSYEGKINLDKPSFMFFKETFNPGWVLKLSNGRDTYKIDNHYLGNLYGNSYFIDKVGQFDFKLEFESQKTVNEGITASVIGWLGILGMLVYSEFRRRN